MSRKERLSADFLPIVLSKFFHLIFSRQTAIDFFLDFTPFFVIPCILSRGLRFFYAFFMNGKAHRRMKLRRDYIESLSERMLHQLAQKGCLRVTGDPKLLCARIANTILADLKVEDDLDDEVRTLLEGYAQQMRQQHIEYHEMFQMVKRKLVKERNLIL